MSQCEHGVERVRDLIGPSGFAGPIWRCQCCRSNFGSLTEILGLPHFCKDCAPVEAETPKRDCWACKGTGSLEIVSRVVVETDNPLNIRPMAHKDTFPCAHCNGTGRTP